MKQLTWEEAETVAAEAAKDAKGFSLSKAELAQTVKITSGITGKKMTVTLAKIIEDAERYARSAAVLALRAAGLLDDDRRREQASRDRHVARATREHEAFKKASGLSYIEVERVNVRGVHRPI